MNLILIPVLNWEQHERKVFSWGIHHFNGCILFRTGRGWGYIDESKGECSDLIFGDIVTLGDIEYEVQIQS